MFSKKNQSERSNYAMAVGFALPAALFSILLVVYPIINTVIMSFQDISFIGSASDEPTSFTLDNYIELFTSSDFWASFGRSLLFTFIALTISFLLGFSLALLLNRKFRFQKFVRMILLLSWPIPGIAVGLLFIWMFDANFGIINEILKSLGIIDQNIRWLTTGNSAAATVIMATIWKSYPFFTLTLLAGLKGIPTDFYEAASIDGANSTQKLFHITVPALHSVIVTSLLLNGLWVFRNYDLVYSITAGGPNKATETLPLMLYNEAFRYYNMGYASTIGIFTLLMCSVMVFLAWPALKKQFY